jgi:hypothetical protein
VSVDIALPHRVLELGAHEAARLVASILVEEEGELLDEREVAGDDEASLDDEAEVEAEHGGGFAHAVREGHTGGGAVGDAVRVAEDRATVGAGYR